MTSSSCCLLLFSFLSVVLLLTKSWQKQNMLGFHFRCDDSWEPSHSVISNGQFMRTFPMASNQSLETSFYYLFFFTFLCTTTIWLSLWNPWPINIQYSLENIARVKCFIKLDSCWDGAVRIPHQHRLSLGCWVAP